ncbi:hypothetical protein L198_00566 [Cryptococcus wingfieldii CBS 7118]|uniref:Uncharacterized protein n=1 Tax=Cryptococcus wingfieldii CBS 7118 TaxID=1295528 RepID=A0A1E3K7K1_9TREE|nr:hypothetical protein L198_00566 [Cryptococcus wingfieldii CBS 7118]ODO08833.1 hypothetical protein L198_00566 [Cryptococcus wingfieldii CBS 7118]
MDLSFDDWWFHGKINSPPADGVFMDLPAGSTFHGEVACNKALTSFGEVPSKQTGEWACEGDGSTGGIGAMHTADEWESSDPQDVKGCGIAIAYKSDVSDIQPEDFTVITVNYTCPWKKHVDFQIPSDLPACPKGGCHCMWGWVHAADAGSEQNYFVGYRCNVTGATGTTALPQANTANKCDYPTDTSNCTVGAKQPHYWFQKERNNNPQGTYDPPFYNGAYGFMNGAQTDLFAAVGNTSTTSSHLATSAGSTTILASEVSSAAVSSSAVSTSAVSSTAVSSSASSVLVSNSSSAVPATAAVSSFQDSVVAPLSASADVSISEVSNSSTSSVASPITLTRTITTHHSTATAMSTASTSSNSASSSVSSSIQVAPSSSATGVLAAAGSSNGTVSYVATGNQTTTAGHCMSKRSGNRLHRVRDGRRRSRVLRRAVGGAKV